MNLWKRIRQLSIKQLFRLAGLCMQKPFLIGPSIRATQRTMKICNTLFGGAHHKNGRPNAFRHALWNILIGQETLKRTKNTQKSALWTQKLTNLYEKVTKNEFLDQAMDLHNNEVGRIYFLELYDRKEKEIIDFLQKQLVNAKKLVKIEEIENNHTTLVYISE